MPQFDAMEGFQHFSIAAYLGNDGLVTKLGALLTPVLLIGGALVIGYFALAAVRKGRA